MKRYSFQIVQSYWLQKTLDSHANNDWKIINIFTDDGNTYRIVFEKDVSTKIRISELLTKWKILKTKTIYKIKVFINNLKHCHND